MINCIAIDDEPLALEVIRDHSLKVSFLNLQETFRNPIAAIDFLQNNRIDLIFLDINMPKITGLEFLDLLSNPPLVVFTTAYSEYAIKGYEYDAIYYLLKPFNFQQFLKAVTKVNEVLAKKTTPLTQPTSERITSETPVEFVHIKSGTQIHKIKIEDIQFLKKDSSYVFFHLKDKKIISRLSINEIFDLLPTGQFIRVHKSYIIAVNKIDIIETHQVNINKTPIPIGNMYRESFLKSIQQ